MREKKEYRITEANKNSSPIILNKKWWKNILERILRRVGSLPEITQENFRITSSKNKLKRKTATSVYKISNRKHWNEWLY